MLSIDTIYLLQTREFIGTNIFKIGRTQNITKRIQAYPKNSVILYFATCSNAVVIEKQVITLFIKKYKQRKYIGTEYFEGEYSYIIKDIKQILYDDVSPQIINKENNNILPITTVKPNESSNSTKVKPIESPIELFVTYLIKDCNTEKLLLNSSELMDKFNVFVKYNNINYNVNTISLCIRLKNLNIKGVKTGINTNKCKKTEFIKKDIEEHFGI